MPQELSLVTLRESLPAVGLTAGAVGTVLEVLRDGHVLVEFADEMGQPIAELVLARDQIAPHGL